MKFRHCFLFAKGMDKMQDLSKFQVWDLKSTDPLKQTKRLQESAWVNLLRFNLFFNAFPVSLAYLSL